MRPGWLLPLSLAAMSIPFFVTILAPLTDMVLWGPGRTPPEMLLPLSSLVWDNTLPALIGLCGGLAFIAATREEDPAWYRGIPLILGFAFIAFSPAFFTIFPLSDPSPAFCDPLPLIALFSAYGTFLLPPCALLFFWLQRDLGRWRTVLIIIALIATLNAFFFLFSFFSSYLVAAGVLPAPQPQFIDGHPVKTDGEGLLFLFIHLTIGLPVLGICFLALAVSSWYACRRADPDPASFPEVQS